MGKMTLAVAALLACCCCCCGLISAAVIEIPQMISSCATSAINQYPAITVGSTGSVVTLQCQLLTATTSWIFTPSGGGPSRVIVGNCPGKCQPAPGLDPRYSVDTNGGKCNLVISDLALAHAGTYTCQDMWGQVAVSTNLVISSDCPAGFTLVKGVGCYKLELSLSDWATARSKCAALAPGARSVVITNQVQQDAVRALIKTSSAATLTSCKNGFWTSGRRGADVCSSNTVWYWMPDDQTRIPFSYFDWPDKEPNCSYNDQYCLQLGSTMDYHYNDMPCVKGGASSATGWSNACAACEMTGTF